MTKKKFTATELNRCRAYQNDMMSHAEVRRKQGLSSNGAYQFLARCQKELHKLDTEDYEED